MPMTQVPKRNWYLIQVSLQPSLLPCASIQAARQSLPSKFTKSSKLLWMATRQILMMITLCQIARMLMKNKIEEEICHKTIMPTLTLAGSNTNSSHIRTNSLIITFSSQILSSMNRLRDIWMVRLPEISWILMMQRNLPIVVQQIIPHQLLHQPNSPYCLNRNKTKMPRGLSRCKLLRLRCQITWAKKNSDTKWISLRCANSSMRDNWSKNRNKATHEFEICNSLIQKK